MYLNHYFLEKSMEEHNRSIERESRSWWRNRKDHSPARPAPNSSSPSPAPDRNSTDSTVCGQANSPRQA